MSVLWDEVGKLLNIAKLAHEWPNLRPIHDAAIRELQKHAEVAAKDNADAKKVVEDKKAEEQTAREKKAAEAVAVEKKAEEARTKPVEPKASFQPVVRPADSFGEYDSSGSYSNPPPPSTADIKRRELDE